MIALHSVFNIVMMLVTEQFWVETRKMAEAIVAQMKELVGDAQRWFAGMDKLLQSFDYYY